MTINTQENKKETYVKCAKCDDEIFYNIHKVLTHCKCGAILVDGCEDYIRIGGNKEDMEQSKFKIPNEIILVTMLCVALSILRVIFFKTYSLIYLLWNIFLAFLPFITSSIILKYEEAGKLNKITLSLMAMLWLILMPNAPYIVTDLIHLTHTKGVPVIFDTFLLFTSAWTGLLLGMHSLSHMEKIIKRKYKDREADFMIVAIIFLISFGLYLGRFLRLNSWDIFVNPANVSSGLISTFTSRSSAPDAIIFTTLSFIFILVFYHSWKNRYIE